MNLPSVINNSKEILLLLGLPARTMLVRGNG